MTDEQIIKALECCISDNEKDCKLNCPYKGNMNMCVNDLPKNALDLINRQKAENEKMRQNWEQDQQDKIKTIYKQKAEVENLNIELQAMRGAANSYKAEIEKKNTEIDILIRKKETLQDEICELQTEINRLKDFEHIYNDLCCQVI